MGLFASESIHAALSALTTHTEKINARAQTHTHKRTFCLNISQPSQAVYTEATQPLIGYVASVPYIETWHQYTVVATFKKERAAVFPFVIIRPSVLFFSFPLNISPLSQGC